MDWAGVGLAVAAIAVGALFVGLMIWSTSAWAHRPRKPTRLRKAEGEYQPPEPPEGRYWG